MSPSEWAAWIGVGLAAASLIWNWLSSRTTTEIQREQLEMQRKVTSLELAAHERRKLVEQKADLRIEYVRNARFAIVNLGQGVATDVSIEMMCPDGDSAILANWAEKHLPIMMIEANGDHSVPVGFDNMCAPPLDATLEWTDEDGERRRKTVTVT